MIPRMTTVGTLKNYRYDLNRSNNTMAKSMNKVITRRNFNSYAEDPALATRCFQLRRSFQRTASQLTVNESIRRKYDVAWSAMDGVSQDINTVAKDTAFTSILTGLNDPDGSGRNALGQSMAAKAKSIIQTMNGRYGENYVFAGADHLEVPFTWQPEENKGYIAEPDPTNPDHEAAFKYKIDPNLPEATTPDGKQVLFTNDETKANLVPQENPTYDEAFTNSFTAANPPTADDIADPRYGKYLRKDGTGGTTNPTVAKQVPEENKKYDPNATSKYLKTDGTGTNKESEAHSILYYRGVPVDSMDETDQKKMEYFMKGETKYLDLGLGFKEQDGEAVSSSVFDAALQGVYYLGGTGTEKVMVDIRDSDPPVKEEMELPNNIVSIMSRMSEILLNCRAEDGEWASKSEESEFFALAQRFEDQASLVKQRWDEMDTESSFLRDNGELLSGTADSLSQQFMELEDADPAGAITEYMFARYCYDAALKVGNSVLSQSLMDYMNF